MLPVYYRWKRCTNLPSKFYFIVIKLYKKNLNLKSVFTLKIDIFCLTNNIVNENRI